jgi:hypothetical protein
VAKATIISVDLGEDISEIISDDVREITEQNQEAIDEAIAEQRQVQRKRTDQADAKLRKEQAVTSTLESIYDALLSLPDGGYLTTEQMGEMARPIITNTSALVLQLKSFIRKHKGNAHVLKKCTRGGKPAYTLVPFNATEN